MSRVDGTAGLLRAAPSLRIVSRCIPQTIARIGEVRAASAFGQPGSQRQVLVSGVANEIVQVEVVER